MTSVYCLGPEETATYGGENIGCRKLLVLSQKQREK